MFIVLFAQNVVKNCIYLFVVLLCTNIKNATKRRIKFRPEIVAKTVLKIYSRIVGMRPASVTRVIRIRERGAVTTWLRTTGTTWTRTTGEDFRNPPTRSLNGDGRRKENLRNGISFKLMLF
jgi:hypothetical protein